MRHMPSSFLSEWLSLIIRVFHHPASQFCDRPKIIQHSNTHLYPRVPMLNRRREEKIKNEERNLNQAGLPPRFPAISSSDHITIGYSFSSSFPNNKRYTHSACGLYFFCLDSLVIAPGSYSSDAHKSRRLVHCCVVNFTATKRCLSRFPLTKDGS